MTIWLGARLSLRGGRAAIARLALVMTAVAAGVVVLLATLSLFNAFRAAGERPCWECTTGSAPGGWVLGATPNTALWNYHKDSYAGRAIKRLDVAVLGPKTPALPGVPALPAAGRYYASPALAGLLDTVPRDQLADRFPGTEAGLVGPAALSGPDDLVIVIGRTPDEVAAMGGTVAVDTVATGPVADDTTALYQHGFGIAAVGLLVPLLIFIGTATRLAATRREERFAAIRLVGATSRQINVIASVDAALGALLGALAGVALFQWVRPAVADVAIIGSRFFPETVAPDGLQYAAVLVGVPLAAVGAGLWSLRRVRVTPLGVARKVRASAPGWWRVLPLAIGLGMYAGPVFWGEGRGPDAVLGDVALVLIMVGLVVAGPWLTMLAARLAARRARGAATLLAAQRLAAHPKAAFRSVNGIVLAVFIGTAVAGIVPAVVTGQRSAGGGALNEVVRASFGQTLSPAKSAELLDRLDGVAPGTVLPVYARPERDIPAMPERLPDCDFGVGCKPPFTLRAVVECDRLAAFPVLGRCPAGGAVAGYFMRLLTSDNMLTVGRSLPIIDGRNPAVSYAVTDLGLTGVLVSAPDPAARERVRTLLTTYLAASGSRETPMTFAEVAQVREVLLDAVERVALAIVVLTLLVAGCGLLVAVAGGLVERRQPFTLLRLSGTPARTLSAVVLLETAVPMSVAAVLAAGAGLGVAGPLVDQLAIASAPVAVPGPAYFLTVGGGLVAALLVIAAALPLLKRMTTPENVRFE
ncbi:FtsX-like permease family protein [Nonomuraea phyllanthi]|uniref:FtsX-like permease family protein n=1 Tax=Nonomuraea phyllanthi TaxID=2219224 RepID=A0A5C4WBR4_9ACTN|nr:FtsX-like permease family protein [Nonomuraea phyllanthi]KAB8193102.1 FtsX-like permease family protein [Nonomuraea phyllanthi]QFY11037.1 FtsX-like permease family protein [Nonomuraea phyllanthi]